MTGPTRVERSLAKRVRVAIGSAKGGRASVDAPAAGLLDSLRHHLLAGETHYPARPGMTPLRERIAARLAEVGLPARGAESVLVTASEGEAVFVTLLGLGVVPGGAVVGSISAVHQPLLDWTDVKVSEGAATSPIVTIGDRLFGDDGFDLDPDEIIIGSLDGLDGMRPFTLGFVGAQPDTVATITKWKQASSICAPGPSQRAALWALGVRP